MKNKIYVTKTFLPSIETYQELLAKVWEKQWLTNRGELVLELEEKLKSLLNIPYLTLTNNGTSPLQISLKNLAKGGEVITTPFSYVATTAAIVWEQCTPVFVDIDPLHLTIDENLIEAAITEKTTAILATHVFGNPCNVEVIEQIAQKHNLSVIYDGAHAFSVSYKKKSLFSYGDVSTCSFHATKLFHTGEGGAMMTNNLALHKQLFYSHNFGHKNATEFNGLGINAKMSELQAAMGLAVLPHMDFVINERKRVVDAYNNLLDFNFISTIKIREGTEWNYSYYPVIFNSEADLLRVMQKLNDNNVFPRRYFYPSLNNLDYIKDATKCIIAENISKRILCLPLYHSLSNEDIQRIVKFIR